MFNYFLQLISGSPHLHKVMKNSSIKNYATLSLSWIIFNRQLLYYVIVSSLICTYSLKLQVCHIKILLYDLLLVRAEWSSFPIPNFKDHLISKFIFSVFKIQIDQKTNKFWRISALASKKRTNQISSVRESKSKSCNY